MPKPLFCCTNVHPYKPGITDHESKFNNFKSWAEYPRETSPDKTHSLDGHDPYVVQLVRQVNYGPLESTRYLAPSGPDFVEVTESALIDANFQKVNSYKNYRCDLHNKFFEMNLYQKDPVNKHHWRVNAARPGCNIDL